MSKRKTPRPDLYIVRPPGIVYEGETDAQAAAKDRAIAKHNAAVKRRLAGRKRK